MRAVIFDMDGLLIDSEPLWLRAEIEVFGEVGVVLDEDDCAKTKGLRIDDIVAYWHARKAGTWDDSRSPRDTEKRLVERMRELIRAEGAALPGVRHALAIAKKNGRKIALASSSPRTLIDAVLERLDLATTFDIVQSAETEPLGKPHPGIFLTTAFRLGVAPVDCLVLEDSLTGVVAAKAARMAVIAVPSLPPAQTRGPGNHPEHDARFVLSDGIVGSLAEISEELLAAIARDRA